MTRVVVRSALFKLFSLFLSPLPHLVESNSKALNASMMWPYSISFQSLSTRVNASI